jgi:hypothetical protein
MSEGWNIETLHEKMLQMFHDRDKLGDDRLRDYRAELRLAIEQQDRLTKLALDAQQSAVEKAEIANNKRFDSVNEFRAALSDQTNTFMSRSETEAIINSVRAQMEQKYQTNSDKIDALIVRVERSEGKNTGAHSLWLVIVGIIATISVLINIFNTLKRQ